MVMNGFGNRQREEFWLKIYPEKEVNKNNYI